MSTHVDSVRLESARELTHVPCPRPRLTWVVATDVSGWHQLEAEVVWTDGSGDQAVRLQSSESVNVAWPFPGLPPRGQGQLKVRVRGEDGWSGFSATYDVAAAFLGGGEWQAEFVGLGDPARRAQPVLVRHEFDVPAGLTRATWYATALGVYEAWFNGRPVDDEVLKPGWTPYQFRRVLQTVDVTARLEPGRNAVGVAVAGGWYAEQFGFHGLARTVYGDQPLFAGQLLLEFADGSQTWVRSGQGWRATGEGPWVAAGLYAGETYDARRWPAGWTRAGYDDAAWTPVRVEAAAIGAHPAPVPAARTTPAARVTRRVPVAQVLTSPAGKLLLDFGQNLVGRLRIRVTGEAGTTITLRHAEVLEAGELGVRTLRFAAATDTYVLAGGGVEDWAPAFTFHGFRYAEVTGWPGELDAGDIVAEVVHQDMARTGWFDCSDPLVARLHENVVWGMRGNFLYLPTDCPQRDERLGWTGDIQVFGPTASYLFDCDTFLASWLKDLALEQAAAGGVPFVVPDVLDSGQVPATGWGDVAVLLPWVLFQRFADVKVLADQYESMQAWVDQILALAGSRYLWEGGFQFGDWVDPDSPPDQPGKSKVSPDLVASAYLYHTTSVFAQIARRLGRSEAERYGDVAARIRTAWLAEYVTPAGRAMSDVQTAYALAIEFGLVEGEVADRMGERLAWLVRRDGYRIGTGFLGTPVLCDALTRTGHLREAGRMLTQTQCPSWLYPITMGATTIWERWDSLLPDGSINPGEMTSFNHYALGAIADWMHRVVGGLAPGAPGYQRIVIAPRPLEGLTWAKTSHATPYGLARVEWRLEGDVLIVTAVVPANCTADVRLPDGQTGEVGAGTYEWTVPMAAAPAPVAVGVDSTLDRIIDDKAAYEAVVEEMTNLDSAAAREFVRHTDWVPARTLFDEFNMTRRDIVAAVADRLARLNRARGLR